MFTLYAVNFDISYVTKKSQRVTLLTYKLITLSYELVLPRSFSVSLSGQSSAYPHPDPNPNPIYV